jgi:two-component system, NtrC family, sensor kinase
MTPNILIVDDSLTVRMHLAEAFSNAGFRALPCANVADARAVLASERIDVAILDVVLPDGDGIELLTEIRKPAAQRRVVVLMLTSEVEVRDRIRGLTTGADEYVGKPYDIGYVVARTRELLQREQGNVSEKRPILLIDDSATLRGVLSEALEAGGYRVMCAATGEEGLRIAALHRPEAIIVDGVLPGMDGPSVIRHVRLDAALRRVVCVLLTESREIDAELRALDAGADAFVNKGEDATLLLAKLQALLRKGSDRRSDAETRSLLGPSRILAVDDSPTYRELVATALRAEGYDVIQVGSGEEALQLLSVQQVDCVLLDLVMPGIGGKETCRRIKASPAARDIPVVVLTALEDRTSMLESLSIGADDYIEKSAELDVLKARVRAQLRRRQFEDETRRVRERLLRSEIESADVRRAREVTEMRAALVEELEAKNSQLGTALEELQSTQAQLVQSAKMASLGELVAGIAHEINNPLAFSLSHLSTVKKSLSRAELAMVAAQADVAKEHWDRAQQRISEMSIGLERIRELVVKLKTFSHIDEGEWRRANIRECIESVLTILGHRLRGRIVLETCFGLPDELDCFPSLLNQAVMNLVVNSIDAIEGDGTIRIVTGAVEGGQYQISVKDSGSGIPVHLRDRVFEPFFTTKPVGEGTGLGLSITYSIVKKHEGQLLLECPSSGGTEFIIRVPLVRQSSQPGPAPS